MASYHSEVKQLNTDFVNYLKDVVNKSPYWDLTPTLEDYIRQFKGLEELKNKQTEDDQEESTEPPAPEEPEFDEPNAKLNFKCKLYSRSIVNGKTDIHLVGAGKIFVKGIEGSADKHHIIVRQNPDFKKVIFNNIVSRTTPIREVAKTGISLMVPEDGETKMFIIKLRDNEAKEVYKMLTGK